MNRYMKYFEQHRVEVEQRIDRETERNRKSDFTLTFRDAEGNPLRGKLTVRQKTHDFKFGCNVFMLDQFPDEEHNLVYREKFPELFNYAVAPFYWSDYEVEDGKPRTGSDAPNVYRRPAPELVLRYAAEHGIALKGHCLMWQRFLPDWLPDRPEENMFRIQRRIREIAAEYGTRIRDFDVVNETLARKWEREYENKMPYDCTNRTFAYADTVMPGNRLFINETTENVWHQFRREHSAYYMQIENLLLKGRRVDAIGLQYHIFTKQENLENRQELYLNPIRLYDVLDTYGRFDRPLHISEITVPAFGGTEETLAEQAEMTEWLYRLWFSHESVESIVWWNFVDGTAAYAPLGSEEGENYYHGGLLSYDMGEKPVYRVLKRLIHQEWKTNVETEVNGTFTFRGFHGDYEAIFEDAHGKKTTVTFPLLKQGRRTMDIVCQ